MMTQMRVECAALCVMTETLEHRPKSRCFVYTSVGTAYKRLLYIPGRNVITHRDGASQHSVKCLGDG